MLACTREDTYPLNPDRPARATGDLLTIGKRVVERGAILRINDPAITFDGTDMMAEVKLTVFGMTGMVEKPLSAIRFSTAA